MSSPPEWNAGLVSDQFIPGAAAHTVHLQTPGPGQGFCLSTSKAAWKTVQGHIVKTMQDTDMASADH